MMELCFSSCQVPAGTFQESGSSFRRKLSKREKKQLKKQEKLNRVKSTGSSTTVTDENDSGVAEKLYTGSFSFYFYTKELSIKINKI